MLTVDAQIWNEGVKMLVSTGGGQREVRAFLGGLAKTYGRPKLAAAIVETRDSDPVDPRGYLVKVLEGRAARASVGKSQLTDSEEIVSTCECSGTKKIFVKKKDAQFDWELEPIDCPKCS